MTALSFWTSIGESRAETLEEVRPFSISMRGAAVISGETEDWTYAFSSTPGVIERRSKFSMVGPGTS